MEEGAEADRRLQRTRQRGDNGYKVDLQLIQKLLKKLVFQHLFILLKPKQRFIINTIMGNEELF